MPTESGLGNAFSGPALPFLLGLLEALDSVLGENGQGGQGCQPPPCEQQPPCEGAQPGAGAMPMGSPAMANGMGCGAGMGGPGMANGMGCGAQGGQNFGWAGGGGGNAFSIGADGTMSGPSAPSTCANSYSPDDQNKMIDVMKDGEIGIRLSPTEILDINPHAPGGTSVSIVDRGGANSCAAWRVAHDMGLDQGLQRDPNNCPVLGDAAANTCAMRYGTLAQSEEAAQYGYNLPVV
jgi:hypothetical protein